VSYVAKLDDRKKSLIYAAHYNFLGAIMRVGHLFDVLSWLCQYNKLTFISVCLLNLRIF
jgi:hypothetical protein